MQKKKKKKKKKKRKKNKKKRKKNNRVSGFKVTQTQNGRTMLLSKCVVFNKKKKSRFMEELEAKGILRSLGLETPLGKIQLLGDILF